MNDSNHSNIECSMLLSTRGCDISVAQVKGDAKKMTQQL